jgi:hypothetical protein
MKTPSLFAQSGNCPDVTLADQVARERSSGTFSYLPSRSQGVAAGSLVEMLLKWTRVAGNSPRISGDWNYISDDRNNDKVFEERK